MDLIFIQKQKKDLVNLQCEKVKKDEFDRLIIMMIVITIIIIIVIIILF